MKQLLALILVIALLLACGVGAVLLARGWITLRTPGNTCLLYTSFIVRGEPGADFDPCLTNDRRN